MNILLIGDYSMVHKNLKDGLEQLGHTVVLTSDGDHWKKLPGSDFPMTPKLRTMAHTRIGRVLCHVIDLFAEPYLVKHFYRNLCTKYCFDIIHMMSADLFTFWHRKRIYRFFLRLSHNSLYVSIPGDDYYIYQAWKNGAFRYLSFDDNPEKIKRFNDSDVYSKISNRAYKYTIERAKALIPLNPFETEMPYKGFANLRQAIPFPVNPNSIVYSDNVIDGKIKIYHGVSYTANKGSDYILEALKIISERYSDSVEIYTSYQLPYETFIENMSECNIYIDQCKSYSYGMSAVIAMAMGKIVLSGLEPETLPSIKTPDCPVYNIIPDTEQIIETLERILEKRNSFEEIGYRGRSFVEKEHDYIKVAKMYIEEWAV